MSEYQEIRRTFIKLGDHGRGVPCLLYEPLHPGEKSRIGIVLMHSDDDYMEFVPAPELAKRGYRVAAAHVTDPSEPLDVKMAEVGKVVDYLRSYPGIDKVLLLGHSGGATLMSAYQNAAENGVRNFEKGKLIAINGIDQLDPADGMMLLDSNFGNGVMSLLSLDPSIVDESSGRVRDYSLDMFEPVNGYGLEECHFTEEFIHRFLYAQAERMNRLIDFCESRIDLIDHNAGIFEDDEPLVIPGATQFGPFNKLFPQMPSIFSHTKSAHELIHADGSITNEIVPCRRVFRPGMDSARNYSQGALVTTVRTFLKSSAVRVDPDQYWYDESSLYGVDWTSSYCVTVGNMEGVTVPLLLMGMTGSYEYIAAEHIYEHALRSKDKTVAFVEGASHIFRPEKQAEKTPGEFGDTVRNCFDYADRWIETKFV